MNDSSDPTDLFQAERSRLFGIAYRMLGSRAECEDVLQDAWLRWHEAPRDTLRTPQAWLTTVVTHLAIDRLRAARELRQGYFGTWLPEPIAVEDEASAPPPEARAELAGELSIAFLAMLERLSAEERAAFLLHDVFDEDYPDVARMLDKTEAACRQLVHRARTHLRTGRARYRVDEAAHLGILKRFVDAARTGDRAALGALIHPEAVAVSDGGGKAIATFTPMRGADRIARLYHVVARRAPDAERRLVRVNGQWGFASYYAGRLHSLTCIQTDGERITAFYTIANPDKLGAAVQAGRPG